MRMPSSKRLQSEIGLDAKQARLIRAIGHATDDAERLRFLIDTKVPKTAQYVQSMFSDPYHSHMWRVTVALYAIDCIVGTFGVEPLGEPLDSDSAPPYEYLNTGDTYAATLIYKRETDALTIGSWGDIAEKHPEWE